MHTLDSWRITLKISGKSENDWETVQSVFSVKLQFLAAILVNVCSRWLTPRFSSLLMPFVCVC